jgi:hypothetical protein
MAPRTSQSDANPSRDCTKEVGKEMRNGEKRRKKDIKRDD